MWDKGKEQCRTKVEYYGTVTVDEEENVVPKKRRLVRTDVKGEKSSVPLSMVSCTHVAMGRVLRDVAGKTGLEGCPKAWRKKAMTGCSCFHDITSLSSYSTRSDAVEWGYNKDKEDLRQVNLAMVSDSGSECRPTTGCTTGRKRHDDARRRPCPAMRRGPRTST